MQNVVRPGPQPPTCVLDTCERPQLPGEVYCRAHLEWFARQNGTAIGPPVNEPDDPDLLEREARRARAQEEEEYRERRRIKTWKTLDNGSRVPDEYYSDDELEAIEAAAGADLAEMERRLASTGPTMADVTHITGQTTAMSAEVFADLRADMLARASADDELKRAAKRLKAALRGRHGPAAQKMAWALAEQLEQ